MTLQNPENITAAIAKKRGGAVARLTPADKAEMDQIILAQAQANAPNWVLAAQELAALGVKVTSQTVGKRAKRLGITSQRQQKMATVRQMETKFIGKKRQNITATARSFGLSVSAGQKIATKHKVKGIGRRLPIKEKAIQELLKCQQDITNDQIIEELSQEFGSLSIRWVETVRAGKRALKAKQRKNRPPKREASFAERRVILRGLANRRAMRSIHRETGFSDVTIKNMAEETWIPSGKDVAFDTTIFITAAEELVRRQLQKATKEETCALVERYFNTLPPQTLDSIAEKYRFNVKKCQFSNRREEAFAQYLGKFSSQTIRNFIGNNGSLICDPNRYAQLRTVPAARAAEIIRLHLNEHPDLDIEPNAVLAIRKLSARDINQIIAKVRLRPSMVQTGGWLAQLEGVRDWADKPFLDCYATHYLDGVTISYGKMHDHVVRLEGPKHLQSLTEKGYLGLHGISTATHQIMHCCFAARGVIFNRLKIRRMDKAGVELAPSRDYLEKMAPQVICNPC